MSASVIAWWSLTRHDLPETEAFDLTSDQEVPYVEAMLARLAQRKTQLLKWDKYYRGTQPVAFLHPEIKLEMGDRLENLVINLPRVALDSVEERLDVEGFRLPGVDKPDEKLWTWWQSAGLDLASGRNHLRAMRHGCAFVSVWSGGRGGLPRVAVETAMECVGDYYPGTCDLRAVVKGWKDGEVEYANLYLSSRVVKYWRGGKDEHGVPVRGWAVREVLDNTLGVVPMVPFLNRYDEDMPDGESELTDVVKIGDAINKLGTDMMVTSEFHAGPRRWATGMDLPKGAEGDRLRAEAKKYWEAATSNKVFMGGKDVTFGQFSAAELANFVNGIQMLVQQFAAVAGLPPHMVGLHGDNPASADAIRSSEASLIKRVQRKQRSFGEPWEDVMRLAIRVMDGKPANGDEALETVWRSPETPTIAQKADAAVKLKTAGIIDDQQAQEDLGYTPQQRSLMDGRRTAAISGVVNESLAERIEMAMNLIGQGVDEKIAFAALHLIVAPKGVAPGDEAPPAPEDGGEPADPGELPEQKLATAPTQ